MKATFQIPDNLYRELKSQTAREGLTLREVAIRLFEQWLRQRKGAPTHIPAVNWQNFQPPLAHLVPENVSDHSAEAIRSSITGRWHEPS